MTRLLALLLLPSALHAAETSDLKFFEDKVHPLLKKHCYACHSHASGKMKGGLALDSRSGWETGGENGPAVVPNAPEKSRLIRMIRQEVRQMPPKGRLADDEIAIFTEWVKRGAPDPRTAKSSVANAEWWSLKPLVRPTVPGVTSNPIDAFVLAKLKEKNLTLSPEADRRTLIRRLTFDLHGLPPTPEEVDAFLADKSVNAYEKLVDRLLASPRYGERWARHWLDVIHFADTHGTEHDLIRPNAWRYRDYVIGRLNADIPYSRFIREQLAADAFFPNEPQWTAALGFLGAGPWDMSTATTAPKTFDYLDRDDMVTQTMSTFASSSVHCARCHDHKFDPISQQDYYSLQAVFAGVTKGDVPFDADPVVAKTRAKWLALAAAADKAERTLLLTAEAKMIASEWEAAAAKNQVGWQTPTTVAMTTQKGTVLRRDPDGSVLATGKRPDLDTYTLTLTPTLPEVTAIRLEVLTDATLPANGPGRAENGNMHLSEVEVQLLTAPGAAGKKLKIRRATADFEQDAWLISHAIDGNEQTAWGIHPREGHAHEAVFELDEPLKLSAGQQLVVALKQLHGRGHVIGRFRLTMCSGPPGSALPIPAPVRDALKVSMEKRSEADQLKLIAHAVRERAGREVAALPAPTQVYAAGGNWQPYQPSKPRPVPKVVHVLKRGDVNKPGEAVEPGTLECVAEIPARFKPADSSNEASRRAALAEWLADPKNPLTWRSIVNRLWQYHFGRGLADTPNDFGRMGSVPTHPELLDWLAVEFRDGGQSFKKLHRLIVMSAAYRQASRHDEKAAMIDGDNRLLWRANRQRLDAESFRDAVLSASGRLDLTMSGPGVKQFQQKPGFADVPALDYGAFDWDSPGANRRSIYRFVYRTLPDPFADALDFPDASQLSPVRGFSASALQALTLLNNDFLLRHSEHLAARLSKASGEMKEQVRQAFRLALQRQPTVAEADAFAAYAKKHGLAAMARVLFNSNEFLFMD